MGGWRVGRGGVVYQGKSEKVREGQGVVVDTLYVQLSRNQ